MSVWRELIASREHQVDALTVGGLAALVGLLIFTAMVVWADPHAFSPLTYGTGAATILGGYGVGKGTRDYMAPPAPTQEDKGEGPKS